MGSPFALKDQGFEALESATTWWVVSGVCWGEIGEEGRREREEIATHVRDAGYYPQVLNHQV